jgi:hypothetical protein
MALGKARLAALLGVVALALALVIARRRGLSPAPPPVAATAPSATSHAHPGAFAVRPEKGAGVIDGVVLDPQRAPMAGAALLLSRQPQSPDDDESDPVPATTDAAGRFAFHDLAAGVYLVTATSSRPGLAPAASGELALSAGQRRTIELRLRTGGGTLRGRVFDSGGGPLPGARVSAVAIRQTPPDDRLEILSEVRAATDQAGNYLLALARGHQYVQVEAAGYVTRSSGLTIDADTTQDFRLDPASSIGGRVLTRAGGQPVGGAEVHASRSMEVIYRTRGAALEHGHAAISDNTGAFRLTGLGPGEYTLEAHQGALVGTTDEVRVAPAQALENVTIFCDGSFAVSGRVVGRDGNQRAIVFSKNRVHAGQSPSAEVEPSGAFRLEGLRPGRYELEVTVFGGGRATKEVQVADRDIEGVVLELGEQHVVRGVVVDPQGRPVTGARVALQVTVDRSTTGREGVTDGGGRFSISTEAGGAATLHAHAPQVGSARWGPQPLETALTTAVVLKLQAGASASGQVRLDDGRPVAGANVRAMQIAGRTSELTQTETGPDGRYVLRGLEAGFVELEASAPDKPGTGATEPVELRIGAGEARTIDLILPTARPLRGRVLLPDGRPAAVARVTASASGQSARPDAPGATTEEDGRFVLDDLEPAMSYDVQAELAGYADARAEKVPARQEVVLRLSPASSLAGVVVDAGGKRVTDFELWTRPLSGATNSVHTNVHDPGGAFALQALPPGQYELRAFTPDRHMGRVEVTVAAGEHKRNLRLALEAGMAVRGRLVDAESGQPLSGVRVRAGNGSGDSDVNGAFALEGVVLERPTLTFDLEGRGYAVEPEPVTVPPGATVVDVGTLRFIKGDLPGKLQGGPTGLIGVSYDVKDGTPIVNRVFAGMPAESAGLRPGDRLLAVDGKSLIGLSQGGRSYLLKGKPGTPVTVMVQSGAHQRTVTLTRQAAPSP